MKTYTPLILIALLFSSMVWAQGPMVWAQGPIQQADISYTGNAIRLSYRPVPHTISKLDIEGKEFLSIGGFMDEFRPGARAIPSELLTIAIPAGSTPRLAIRNAEYSRISNIPPMPNPSARIVGDTAIEFEYSAAVTDPAPMLPAAEITGYGWVRDYYCVYVQVNAYRFDEAASELSVLANIEFDLEFRGGLQQPMMKQSASDNDPIADRLVVNSESAVGWKSRPPVPASIAEANDWIDPTGTYIKVRVGEDGIYRITGTDLQQWGADLGGIQPATLKIFESGEEVPIYVQSGAGFGAGDYVEFYGHRNYTGDLYRTQTARDTDYVSYLNRYSDSTTYWLTWGGANGQRIPDYAVQPTADTVNSYRHLERLEEENYIFVGDAENVAVQFPNWVNKHWNWFDLKNVGVARTFDYQMPVSDFVPGTSARLLFKFQSTVYFGSSSPAHMVAGYINDMTEPVDSVGIERLEIGILDGSFNSNELTDGTTKIGIQSRGTNSPNNVISGDWIELEYNRYNKPVDDRLVFTIDDNVATPGTKSIVLNGFTGDQIAAYKVAPEFRRYTDVNSADNGGTYRVWFGDDFTGDDTYAVSTAGAALSPTFIERREPGQNAFPGLHATTNNADYIIVTNRFLASSANQYANFIRSEYNVETAVAFVQDIADEFAYGYNKPEAIRDFLQYAYSSWQRPGPVFVLFLGDASWDHKDILRKRWPDLRILKRNVNLVPSIGFPVGDAKMVMWDESDRAAVPQMAYGRVPAISNEDVLGYLERHRAYREADYTEWNKRYILFTGGSETSPGQIEALYNTNQRIIEESIEPRPVSGGYDHFYKTINPKTQYGPYEPSYIANSIANGGVFISYLGHSGTQTWDNGISQPRQLKNDVDRYAVISDFGCSTAKYAEPDVISFSELFTLGPEASAIAYIGNSALGSIAASQTLPRYFYESVLHDTVHTLGIAHMLSKQTLLARQNTQDNYRIAVRTNMLVGDPIIEVPVPTAPNFLLRENEVVSLDSRITELTDSAHFKMVVRNHGAAVEPALEYRMYHTNNDTLVADEVFTIPSPGYRDTVFFALPVRDMKGIHRFTVTLDPNNLIDEMDETDNEASVQFTVSASSATVLGPISSATVYRDEIVVMNPVFPPAGGGNTLYTEIGLAPDFNSSSTVSRQVDFGEVVTRVPISDFTPNTRYYFRYRIDPAEAWSEPLTFFRLEEDAKLAYVDTVSFNDGSRNFFFNNGEITPKLSPLDISLGSAGFSAGNFAVLSIDGINLVSLEQQNGYFLTVLDGETKEQKTEVLNYQVFNVVGDLDSMIAFLGRVADGDILLATIADGATNRDTPLPQLVDAFSPFGSKYIDSLRVNDAWCMIGIKGSPVGSANERYVLRDLVQPANLDTTIYVQRNLNFTDNNIGPAGKWKSLNKTVIGGTVAASVAGITAAQSVDTLQSMVQSTPQDLSSIDAEQYPRIALNAEIHAASPGTAPGNLKVTLEYDLPPELAVNYQTVTMPITEVPKGSTAEAKARIYNVGELSATNAKVEFYFLTPDNDKVLLKEIVLPELAPGAYHDETFSIETADYTGAASFIVELDNDGTVRELTRSNNSYTVPFTILGDTTRPTLDVTIDGILPYDGDYVRSRPDVVVKLFDNSPIPIEDASSFLVYLNDTLVIDNPGYDVTFQPGTGEEKGTVLLRPILEDGTHFFKFNALDESGNRAFDEDMEVMVIVESDAQLFDLYNVPNPFSDKTAFTFTITGTQVPQEMEIKVFTVAGRLIRDIIVPPSQLRIGYNNIRWDGRDEDGDLLANGTYLYKVSYTMDSGKQYVIGKLAVLR